MNNRSLFDEKLVPVRKLSKWEIQDKLELAKKFGVKLERRTQLKNFYERQS